MQMQREERITAETRTPSTGTGDSESARHNHLQRWKTQVALSATFIHSFNNRRNQGSQQPATALKASRPMPRRSRQRERGGSCPARADQSSAASWPLAAFLPAASCGIRRSTKGKVQPLFPRKKTAHSSRSCALDTPFSCSPASLTGCLGKWRPSRSAASLATFLCRY